MTLVSLPHILLYNKRIMEKQQGKKFGGKIFKLSLVYFTFLKKHLKNFGE